MKFKKTIYIQYEKLGNHSVIITSDNIKELEDGEVAVYELKGVKKAKKTVTIK